MKTQLKTGDRVRLISMPEDPHPIAVGELGTVQRVRDFGDWSQVEVDWDNGRTLMLTIPDDCVAVVGPNE